MENRFGSTPLVVPGISNVADAELGTGGKVAPKAAFGALDATKGAVPNIIVAGELLAEALAQFGFAEAALALRTGIWILRLLTSTVAMKAFNLVIRAARRVGGALARLARGVAGVSVRMAHAVYYGIRFLGCRSQFGWRRLRSLARRRW